MITLYLSDRCNSRCITCDYWRHGRTDMSLDTLRRLLPGLAALKTRLVLFSGGEPLLNREWAAMARLLREEGLQLWLLTSGLSLAKHACEVAALFDSVTVSLDGTTAAGYAAIRGVDAFDKVCEGIRAAVAAGVATSLRVTVQRANYRELPGFVGLAQSLGVQQVSFLAVDVANPHAFARSEDFDDGLALRAEDLPQLDALLLEMESRYALQFAQGFIAESPQKLRRLRAYFAAVAGLGAHPPVRCNAPEFSAVVEPRGGVRPCFFIPGPPDARVTDSLTTALSHEGLRALRARIAAGERRECATCVCSMHRRLDDFELPAAARRPAAGVTASA